MAILLKFLFVGAQTVTIEVRAPPTALGQMFGPSFISKDLFLLTCSLVLALAMVVASGRSSKLLDHPLALET